MVWICFYVNTTGELIHWIINTIITKPINIKDYGGLRLNLTWLSHPRLTLSHRMSSVRRHEWPSILACAVAQMACIRWPRELLDFSHYWRWSVDRGTGLWTSMTSSSHLARWTSAIEANQNRKRGLRCSHVSKHLRWIWVRFKKVSIFHTFLHTWAGNEYTQNETWSTSTEKN